MQTAHSARPDGPSITIDRARGVPIYRQIYERVREGISRGTFRAGARLPSARSLASELGVARGTAEDAYALLAAEGYIERRGPAGSAVSASLGAAGHDLVGQVRRRPKSPPTQGQAQSAGRVAVSPFQMGLPAIDAFPHKVWSRVVARQARKPLDAVTAHGDPRGLAPLRRAIARYLALSRGVLCSPEQVLVTHGYQGAIDLVARSVLRPGDSVWFEDPGYIFAREALRAAGARVVAIEVDADGMRVADGIERAPQARLAVDDAGAPEPPVCHPVPAAPDRAARMGEGARRLDRRGRLRRRVPLRRAAAPGAQESGSRRPRDLRRQLQQDFAPRLAAGLSGQPRAAARQARRCGAAARRRGRPLHAGGGLDLSGRRPFRPPPASHAPAVCRPPRRVGAGLARYVRRGLVASRWRTAACT